MKVWAHILVALALWSSAMAVGIDSGANTRVNSGDERVRWILDPREREVGEVFEAALEAPLAAGESLEVDGAALEADPSWALLDGVRRERSSTDSDAAKGVVARVVVRWSLASLEPGERVLPTPALAVVDAKGARTTLSPEAASARFTSVLAEGEDEPRAPLGFRPIETSASSGLPPWLIASVSMALGALVTLWLVRRRRQSAPAAPPSVLEQLAALEARPVEARDEAREVYYALTALVREHVDERLGESRRAATDEEWIRALAERAPAAVCEELAALLREAGPVKYAAQHPTHWAVRESFERARRALHALDDATRRAA